MRRWPALILVAGLVLVAASRAEAQLVTNGGFETGDFTGWTVFGAGVNTGVDIFTPHTGTRSAFFGENTTSGISQILTTTPGATYTFSFWVRNDQGDGGATPNSFSAYWNNVLMSFFVDRPATGYTLGSFSVTATDPTTQIRFEATDVPSFVDLDDVSVVATTSVTPEPVTMTLLATGLVGMAAAARRRRKASAR